MYAPKCTGVHKQITDFLLFTFSFTKKKVDKFDKTFHPTRRTPVSFSIGPKIFLSQLVLVFGISSPLLPPHSLS
jgi:hypothetical protein